MKKSAFLFTLLSSLLLFTACPFVPYGYDHPIGQFPEDPVNMTEFNSEYDDINMSAPTIEHTQMLIFSSNRNSSGQQFDIIYEPLNFSWDKTEGTLSLSKNFGWMEINTLPIEKLLDSIKTEGDEYGPYAFTTMNNNEMEFFTFYSSNENETNDIRMAYFKGNINLLYSSEQSAEPDTFIFKDVTFLSKGNFNECYLSLKSNENAYSPIGNNFYSQFTQMYFCSDEEGNYNIYSIDIPSNKTLLEYMSTDLDKTQNSYVVFNTQWDERCPYVFNDFIIFSSNRPGGYGGYDFYYSKFENGEWGIPSNMGPKINSEKDEYRAMVISTYEFENDLIVFSSNRDGGSGGFDLYYAGIKIDNLE